MFNSPKGYPNIDTSMDTTIGSKYVSYSEDYYLYHLMAKFDSKESPKIQLRIKMNQNFYDFSNLNIDSNSNLHIMGRDGMIHGYYDKDYLTVDISHDTYMKLKKYGHLFTLLYFLIQTLFSYLMFRIVLSYCRNKFYSIVNSRRMFLLGIMTTIVGIIFYFKGIIQQSILRKTTGFDFRVQAKEPWEFFPYVLILGLFIIVVSRFYKDAVALKENNDLTI